MLIGVKSLSDKVVQVLGRGVHAGEYRSYSEDEDERVQLVPKPLTSLHF